LTCTYINPLATPFLRKNITKQNNILLEQLAQWY